MKHEEKRMQKELTQAKETMSKDKSAEKIRSLNAELQTALEKIDKLRVQNEFGTLGGLKGGANAQAFDFKLAIKLILYSTYTTLERELTIQRIADIAELNKDNLLIRCSICEIKQAIIECKKTQEYVCRNCYMTVQAKLNFIDDQVEMLPSVMTQQFDKELTDELNKLKKKAAAATVPPGSAEKYIQYPWKKFEFYSFPTNVKSEQNVQLSQAFALLYLIYITNNGISPGNEVVDVQKFLRLPKRDEQATEEPVKSGLASPTKSSKTDKSPAGKSVFTTELSRDVYKYLNEFITLKGFNTEEKIFMNRVAFLMFKRSGANANKAEFVRIINNLQVTPQNPKAPFF